MAKEATLDTLAGNSAYEAAIRTLAKTGNKLASVKGGTDRDVAITVSQLWRDVLPVSGMGKGAFEARIRSDIREQSPNGAKHIGVQLTHIFKLVEDERAADVVAKWADGEYEKGEGETLQATYKRLHGKSGNKGASKMPTLEQCAAAIVAGAFTLKDLQNAVRELMAAQAGQETPAVKVA